VGRKINFNCPWHNLSGKLNIAGGKKAPPEKNSTDKKQEIVLPNAHKS